MLFRSVSQSRYAAVKLHIPIAHVEAGLRSFNKKMPEEVNRILTDQISDYLFVPSLGAKNNLLNEGVDESKIFIVGDIMYGVSLYYKEKMIKPDWFELLDLNNFILCTIHRAENTDDKYKLSNIFKGLGLSAKDIILPLHPRTVNKIKEHEIIVPKVACLYDLNRKSKNYVKALNFADSIIQLNKKIVLL